MGFTREELTPINLRLAAANRGTIYVGERTPITVLHMGLRNTDSGVTAPYGTTDDIGRVERSSDVIRKRGTRAATTTEPGKPQLGRSVRC